MEIYKIETGNLKLDGGAMFGVVPKKLWAKAYPCDEDNLCNWAMRCLLVVDGDRRVLIDNGIGDKQDWNFLRHFHLNGEDTLENSLSELGFSKEDITDVILTHLHFDHCGGSVTWNTDRTGYALAFPNATYWTSRLQYEWAIEPNHRESASYLKENILPIEAGGKLKLIDEEGEILPNITVKLFHGHTKGQVIPHIRYKDKTIVFMADLLPSAAHIPMPWIMAYDTRPLITLQDKERFYKEAIENDYILFLEHDLYHECCTLQETEKGVRLKDAFALKEAFH
jgi:glyoxylase-like metal-dependent hydrolase (beta-lactamase superfamily II)